MQAHRLLAVFMTGFIASAAADVKMCTAPAIKAAEVPAGMRALGVALSQPLAFPECEKNQRGDMDYVFYVKNPTALCWQRLQPDISGSLGNCSPIVNDTVRVVFPAATTPTWVSDAPSLAIVINGKVESLIVATLGHKVQESVVLDVTAKYGNPIAMKKDVLQNAMGAKYEAISSSWKSGPISAEFIGVSGNINSGGLMINTPVGLAVYQKELRDTQAAKPRF